MTAIWILIVGLAVGAIARLALPAKEPRGLLVTGLLGVAGAVLAYLIGRAGGWYGGGEPSACLASVPGSVLVLAAYRLVTEPRPAAYPSHGPTRR